MPFDGASAFDGVVVPVTCDRCAAGKRTPDGRLVYVGMEWLRKYRKGREMLCPTCYEGLKAMETLADLVVGWDTEE